MELIFGKTTGQEIKEMQEYASMMPGDLKFDYLKSSILIAQEDLMKYIGKAAVSEAVIHYRSSSYKMIEAPENETAADKSLRELKDELVSYVQMPVAFSAYREYALNKDATHTTTGRTARMDKDQDEYNKDLIDRDDFALLRKSQVAIDRLIKFIDDNKLTSWTGSDIFKRTKSVLLWNTDLFHDYFPIEYSRRLFVLMLTIQAKIQREMIASRVGSDELAAIQAKIKANAELDTDEQVLYELMASPLAEMTVAQAYRVLPIQMFPEQMSRQFWGAGSGNAFISLRDKMITEIEKSGMNGLAALEAEITRRTAEDEETTIDDDSFIDIADRMLDDDKYARV